MGGRTVGAVAAVALLAGTGWTAAVAKPPRQPRPATATSWPLIALLQGPSAPGTVLLRASGRQVCWELKIDASEAPVSAAHLHSVSGGSPLLELGVPGPDGRSAGCATAPSVLVLGLRTAPRSYAVDVHSTAGVTRGVVRPLARPGPVPSGR